MATLTQTDASITNTSINGQDGLVLYEVSTPTALFNTKVTTISRQGIVIATVEWHMFGGTILRFQGREALLDDIFPKSGIISTSRAFVTQNGAPFTWKSKLGKLYCVAPHSDLIIATYHRVKFALFRTTQSSLHISHNGLGIMDELVVTWIVMEKLAADRRKKAARNIASN